MIPSLYDTFKHWSDGGSVWLISDTHFDDADCKLMDPHWITPEEQVAIINKCVQPNDTLIHLGDVGNPEWMKQIRARYKVLILGNHDKKGDYVDIFDEIYTGALIIAEKIMLSHEPVFGLDWCLNIHGHDHANVEGNYADGKHLNLAANVCGYIPKNLKNIISGGAVSKIPSIHRLTIDRATERKAKRELEDGHENDLPKLRKSDVWYSIGEADTRGVWRTEELCAPEAIATYVMEDGPDSCPGTFQSAEATDQFGFTAKVYWNDKEYRREFNLFGRRGAGMAFMPRPRGIGAPKMKWTVDVHKVLESGDSVTSEVVEAYTAIGALLNSYIARRGSYKGITKFSLVDDNDALMEIVPVYGTDYKEWQVVRDGEILTVFGE